MKNIYKILLLLFLIVKVLSASENKASSIDDNRTWHFGLGGGYASYASEVDLYLEKSFKDNHAIFISTGTEFNGNNKVIGARAGISYIYYNDKDAYFLEGLYYNIGFVGYNKTDSLVKNYSQYSTSTGIGYGWHFFNHSFVISTNIGVKYTYQTWNSQNVGFTSISSGYSNLVSYPVGIGMAFVF